MLDTRERKESEAGIADGLHEVETQDECRDEQLLMAVAQNYPCEISGVTGMVSVGFSG